MLGYSLVIISDRKDKKYMVTLKEGARFSTQYGFIEHDEIAKLSQGDSILSSLGQPYRVYLPTYMDFVMNIKRQAQIIYPKDVAAMLMWCDIAPGQKILESGVGQGALSLALLRALAGTGKLTSYELREDFAGQAAKFIKQFLGETPENHEILVRNIYEGIDGVFDRALLDLPEPWHVVKHLRDSLIEGGIVVAYIPTVLQVKTYVDELKNSKYFCEIETAELIRRPWHVEGQSVRPEMWIYAHSAFLVTARKFKPE